MSVIVWPGYAVASCRWHKASQAAVFRSTFGVQAIEASAALWEVDLTGVSETRDNARQIDTFFDSLNGYVNQIALWNVEHPQPSGTMRGAMTLSVAAAQGATSLTITAGSGQAGNTLLRGDLLGLGTDLTQQVVRVSVDATADVSGVIVVPIGTPMRNAFSIGATVVWDKPKALFRQKTLNVGIDYQPDCAQPWTLSLIEDVRP